MAIRTFFALVAATLLAGCDDDPGQRDAGDTGTDGDASDVGTGVDITGDWSVLRYHHADDPSRTPLPSGLDRIGFVQTGETFTLWVGAETFGGLIANGEYLITDGDFTVTLVFPDSDHGSGSLEQGPLTAVWELMRVGAATYDVAGQWLADDGSGTGTPVAIDLDDGEITVQLGEESFLGELARDTALLVGTTQPDDGALAARIRWTSADEAVATVYTSSWTPDGDGHTDYSATETVLTLSRGSVECTIEGDCEETERCIEQTCTPRVEGDPCAGDEACPGDLYCAGDICQDGSTGDLCDATADCADPNDLCGTTCRPRVAGEPCGSGDACPGDLYCVAALCLAGETNDLCRETEDCSEPGDYCRGEPPRCQPGLGLGDTCDPFDPFPIGECAAGSWCEPQSGEEGDGACVAARAGSATQGVACTGPADCASGLTCAPTGECVRYCASEEDEGCGSGQACVAAYGSNGAVVDDVFFCQPPCDYDAGIACADPERACTPGEVTLSGRDQCLDPLNEVGLDAWLSPGDSCLDAGLEQFARCSDLAICSEGICHRLCRYDAGMTDVLGHPDCEWGTCLDFGVSAGLCEQTCAGGAVPFLNQGFDFGTSPGEIAGDVERAGWADFDFPNIADDEATGGTDGDAGLAFQGWIEDGSGSYSFNLESPDSFSSAGDIWFAHADVHIEPGFNPTTFFLRVSWFGVPGGGDIRPLLDSDSLDLMPELTAGSNPTDHREWFRVGLESVMPEGADLAQLQITFAGTTDVGGFQAARIDHVTFALCDED